MVKQEGGEIVYRSSLPSLWQGFRHAVVATVMAFRDGALLLLLTNFVTIKPTALRKNLVRGTRDQVLQTGATEPSSHLFPYPPSALPLIRKFDATTFYR